VISPEELKRRLDAEEEKQLAIVALCLMAPLLVCFLFGLAVGVIFF